MTYPLEVTNLSHCYMQGTPSENYAIKNINLKINEGEFVGIIGHTGSGKSTLISHFNGLLKPTQGTVKVDGIDIWENKESLRQSRFKVGMCFQYPESQLFEETLAKDIAFGPNRRSLSRGAGRFFGRGFLRFAL